MSITTKTASETQKTHLPLTTTFTPPDSCISNPWLASTSGKTWMNLGPISRSECLPSGWQKTDYFSPGICPTGYAIAASGTVIDGTRTETAATCCPSFGDQKYSTRTSSTISESIDCLWAPGPDVTTEFKYTWTDDDGITSSADSSLSSDGHINAYGVYIRWQSSDFSTPPATTPVSNTATTTTAAATTSATASQTSTDPSSSSGLSSGAKAGIGVGVAVGAVLAIAALALFLIRRRRNGPAQYQQSHDEGPIARSAYGPPSEMPTPNTEDPTKYAVELPASTDMPELDGTRK
ncbi:hypothetical protein P170DRAFT_425777 [Aspergillus steynii IBT 23096]|uniref:Mid2 domain-containing protein n=1 Tax=Aspergillus steynii IBT 23096 TaxID=1392250 RepID=A0A2I2G7A8_9EURO|nr:uncharacterized protein P170DRAFT_425777 [Aspergillus steynii IBT 23096]PLB48753.1 hypothetical protein P170DRAFT_425777 [Aspergillus steynii IBT 23096]